VAEAAGIDGSFYGQVERGKNVPSLRSFLSIAGALGVGPEELLPDSARGEKDRLYDRAVQRLLMELSPEKKKLVAGVVSDMVSRLKRQQRASSPPGH
jgi:transcriptional regulator with XRE-family HTH domain